MSPTSDTQPFFVLRGLFPAPFKDFVLDSDTGYPILYTAPKPAPAFGSPWLRNTHPSTLFSHCTCEVTLVSWLSYSVQ